MPLISEAYREQNRLLHETRPDYGRRGSQWAEMIAKEIDEGGHVGVLDYGCGKGELARVLSELGKTCAEYDPAIPGKDGKPEPADLVVCTDVLEHIEPVHLNAVLRDLKRVTRRKLFFNIATHEASKTLPDGRNAHLIVQNADWWRFKLSREFVVISFEDHGHFVYGEAVPAEMLEKVKPANGLRRRPLTREWRTMFDRIRETSAKYASPFDRIETIRMWEGIDDEPADMQVACNLLEHHPRPDAALQSMLSLSRKLIMATIVLTPERGEDYWRKFFEARIRITDWYVENGGLVCTGAGKVEVQGIMAVGAVDEAERWVQVQGARARYSGRVSASPPHSRRAIVACYGPSLASTIDILRREAAGQDVDVFSVSGAHDYLIQHGIIPAGHIECDPRPHKADNIEKPHPGVSYLIASVCHSRLFDKLDAGNADVKLWHVASKEHSPKLIEELKEAPHTVIAGGGSVGLRSIPLLYGMGYRDFYFFGMDCSFSDDGTQQWAGAHAGKRQDVCQVKCGERIFTSSPILLTYATNFFETVQKAPDVAYRLYGDGLLQSMAQYYASRLPQLENEQAA